MTEPSWRKPAGAIGILLYLGTWVVMVASCSGVIGRQHGVIQLMLYLVAGLAWIAPLKPVLQWMETGKWRRLRDAAPDSIGSVDGRAG